MSIRIASHYLYSIRDSASLSWKSMVCELIDNSFGANATKVTLSWPGGKVFSIEDNGTGTSNLDRMFTLGAKRDRSECDIGYYGVGAKQALFWLWGNSTVDTVCGNQRSRVVVEWEDVAQDLAPYPGQETIVVEDANGRPSGMLIKCNAWRRYPSIDDITASIANTYTPGIENGRKIIVSSRGKTQTLQPRLWPKTSQEINDVITAAGREVRIRIGLVCEGEPNPYKQGISFERSFRVIKETMLGLNGYSPIRIAGRVTLGSDWMLSTNKDDFFEFNDELGEAIFDRCGELIRTAGEQAITQEDQAFNEQLAKVVIDAKKREARPGDSGAKGTVEPRHSGRTRSSATCVSDADGSVDGNSGRKSKNGFKIVAYEQDGLSFGEYDRDANAVKLNINNPFLAKHHRARNQDVLVPIVYGILADYERNREKSRTPLFKAEVDADFCTIWGSNVDRVRGKEDSE